VSIALCVWGWLGYNEIKDNIREAELRKKIAEEKKNSPSSSSYSTTSSNTSSTKPNPNEYKPGVTVVATPAVIGDDLLIRTRVNNRNYYSIDEEIELYVVDGSGLKHFVDVLYADLRGGEVGNATSSIKLSKIGPPPYSVVVE
jgi:hypothetical protein